MLELQFLLNVFNSNFPLHITFFTYGTNLKLIQCKRQQTFGLGLFFKVLNVPGYLEFLKKVLKF